MPPLRAVLFDVTGTLIEPAEEVGATYSRVAAEFGVRLPAWRLSDGLRRVLRHAPPRATDGAEPERIEANEIAWWRERVRQTFQASDSTVRFDDFESFFERLFSAFGGGEAWRIRPGAKGALCALREAGLATGAISNFDHRLPNILEDLDIERLLDVVMHPARCGFAKPSPEIFAAALAELDLPPCDAAYVGHDPIDDLEAARRAGLKAIDITGLAGLAELPARLEALATLGAPLR